MSSFRNQKTGIVVSVADDKDDRFASGWDPVEPENSPKKAPAKKAASSKSQD